MKQPKINPIHLTKEGRQELQQELKRLQEKKLPLAVERVARARDFGDLSENAEYHDAREELSLLKGKINELETILARAKVIPGGKSKGQVGLGCKVTVHGNGQQRTFTIVGEWEADPNNQKISHQSPLGQALIGKKIGEKVEINAPAGTIVYTVRKIH